MQEANQTAQKKCDQCSKTDGTLFKCARCKVVWYCGKECQKLSWSVHREPPRDEAEALADASTKHIEDHHKEFRTIIAKYGLDKGDKADFIADLLTNASENDQISVAGFAEKFGMTHQEAYSFLAFIDVGVKYKEEHLKPAADSFVEQLKGDKK